MKVKPICASMIVLMAAGAVQSPSAAAMDFGQFVQGALRTYAPELFGVWAPLNTSVPATVGDYRTPTQIAADQVALAPGLSAEYVTRKAGNKTDMMAFWPNDTAPTHLITCVEGDREEIVLGTGKMNPSVQRVNLATGQVQTILRGMEGCDGIRRTPWGTILATEETSDGGAYEILKPLATTGNTVADRATGAISGPAAANIVKRSALPTMAWEGLEVLPSGVVIGGDELRPGTATADADGGAIFKFIPAVPRTAAGTIADLSESPLAAGNVFAMQVSCVDSKQQFGQGCEVGNAGWVKVNAATARADADAKGATGYYRPEDLHKDRRYTGPGVRFCWTNTGNESGKNYAEVVCGVDSRPLSAPVDVNGNPTARYTAVNRFVEGDRDFNSFDNLDFQPVTGNLYVIEDHDNGDIFACLPDGADRDNKTDGCIKVLTVKDSSAEPTGFIFSADGTTAYLSIQHSNDGLMPKVDDYATDDVVKITGFQLPPAPNSVSSMLDDSASRLK
jgi:hypothetical protein